MIDGLMYGHDDKELLYLRQKCHKLCLKYNFYKKLILIELRYLKNKALKSLIKTIFVFADKIEIVVNLKAY